MTMSAVPGAPQLTESGVLLTIRASCRKGAPSTSDSSAYSIKSIRMRLTRQKVYPRTHLCPDGSDSTFIIFKQQNGIRLDGTPNDEVNERPLLIACT